MNQVARSLGIMDEVNRMKVVPGACPSSSMTNKNVRYMEVNKLFVRLGSESRVHVGSGSSVLVPGSVTLISSQYLS